MTSIMAGTCGSVGCETESWMGWEAGRASLVVLPGFAHFFKNMFSRGFLGVL